MTDDNKCSWCTAYVTYAEMDIIIYLDHVKLSNALSYIRICTRCADEYNEFITSRKNK